MDALSVHWEKLAALFSPPLRKTTAFKVFKKLGLPKDSRRRGYYLLDRSLEILKAGSLIQDSNRHFSAVESVRWALASLSLVKSWLDRSRSATSSAWPATVERRRSGPVPLWITGPPRSAGFKTIVREVNQALGGPLDDEAIARLFERVIDEARRIQRIEAARAEESGGGNAPAAAGQGE